MISFNIPPYTGKEVDYISQAIANHKICGDGSFTKNVTNGLKKSSTQKKFSLQPAERQLLKWLLFFVMSNPAMK